METHTQSVSTHYDHDGIAQRILSALVDSGKPAGTIGIDDLAPADEVHTRGREATVELSEVAHIDASMSLVDVGSGIGGPARYLAHRYGCQVTGVDLTQGFCDAATALTAAVGLSHRVRFHCASALEMPFEDASFDMAWTVQMQMNIADKSALYAEISRALRPGGLLVFQDIVRGTAGALHLPVPWASKAEHSHLVAPEDLREIIVDAGFEATVWRDMTSAHKEWTRKLVARKAPPAPGPVGIHMVLGDDAFEKRRNSGRCLMEDRIGFVQGVFTKRQ